MYSESICPRPLFTINLTKIMITFINHNFFITGFNLEMDHQLDLTTDELRSISSSSLMYFFPSDVSFSQEDKLKAAKGTLLGFDDQSGAWFVVETEEPMDYGANLLDTFITLGHGVPINIAFSVTSDFNGNVNRVKHLKNIEILQACFTGLTETCNDHRIS